MLNLVGLWYGCGRLSQDREAARVIFVVLLRGIVNCACRIRWQLACAFALHGATCLFDGVVVVVVVVVMGARRTQQLGPQSGTVHCDETRWPMTRTRRGTVELPAGPWKFCRQFDAGGSSPPNSSWSRGFGCVCLSIFRFFSLHIARKLFVCISIRTFIFPSFLSFAGIPSGSSRDKWPGRFRGLCDRYHHPHYTPSPNREQKDNKGGVRYPSILGDLDCLRSPPDLWHPNEEPPPQIHRSKTPNAPLKLAELLFSLELSCQA
jgi:hypothetical protein